MKKSSAVSLIIAVAVLLGGIYIVWAVWLTDSERAATNTRRCVATAEAADGGEGDCIAYVDSDDGNDVVANVNSVTNSTIEPNVNSNENTNDSVNDNTNSDANTNSEINSNQSSGVDATNSVKKARDARRLSDIRNIRTALTVYVVENGVYPENLAELLPNYLSVMPVNPTPGGITYYYTPVESVYNLHYSLEVGTDELTAGEHIATPNSL
ncbi:MAG: hypothetical protein V1838_05120 [Patescibacteria group bacterium]